MSISYHQPADNMSGWTDIVKHFAVDVAKTTAGKAITAAEQKLGVKPAAASTTQAAQTQQGGGGMKKSSGPSPLLIGGAIAAVLGIGYMISRKSAA